MRKAIDHYEAALKEAFPSGATGDVFHHWNEARKLLEQAEEEAAVAWLHATEGVDAYALTWRKKDTHDIPLYTTPPKREWVGLTDGEILKLWGSYFPRAMEFYQAIEAKLKEKNT